MNRKFQIKIKVDDIHPDIDPEDMAAALAALLKERCKQKLKRREKERQKGRRPKNLKPEELALEMFLDSFANDSDRSPGLGECTFPDKNAERDFYDKLGQALLKGREPLFDTASLFILRNWRKITAHQDFAHLPGLRDWPPKAVGAFCEAFGVRTGRKGTGKSEEGKKLAEWFRGRRKMLGLSSRRPWGVKAFTPTWEGYRVETID